MKYTELMKQPDGIIFYENDLPAMALFQKVETVQDDLIVREFCGGFEQSRMGFREMDEVDRNSKDYRVYTNDQVELLASFLGLAYISGAGEV